MASYTRTGRVKVDGQRLELDFQFDQMDLEVLTNALHDMVHGEDEDYYVHDLIRGARLLQLLENAYAETVQSEHERHKANDAWADQLDAGGFDE